MEQVRAAFGIGTDLDELSAVQAVLRTLLIYGSTLVLVRLGSKRFLSKASAFDVIIAIMLGSVMSRGINGSAPVMVTVIGGLVLIGTHWLFGLVAFRTGWFGPLIKGQRVLLIKDGKVQQEGMRTASITERDLAQAVRMQTHHRDPTKVKRAYLERNSEISIIQEEEEPRVVEVSVEEGVKTVRIELR